MPANTPSQDYFARAEQLFNSGSYRDAARHYRRAWQLDPTLERAAVYFGDCCFRLGNFFVALQFFWEALLRNREDYLIWMLMGDTYLRLGRPELTSRFSGRALQLNPTNLQLQRTLQLLPVVMSSVQRYFEEQLVPEDKWTSPLDQQRTTALQADIRNTSEAAWTRVCFFYREYLNPKRFQKLERAFDRLLHDSRFAELRACDPARFQAQEVMIQIFLERIRPKIAPLEKYAGPPLRYRFDPADGAPLLKADAVRTKILERKKLLKDKSQQNDGTELVHLRLKGFQVLEAFLVFSCVN